MHVMLPVLKIDVTHKFNLESINEAFDVMHAGESIRSVVSF